MKIADLPTNYIMRRISERICGIANAAIFRLHLDVDLWFPLLRKALDRVWGFKGNIFGIDALESDLLDALPNVTPSRFEDS